MKRRIRNIVSIIIFLILMLLAFFALRPLYRAMNRAIRYVESGILNLVEEKTGLGVSYDRLSPSIFSGVHLNGVVVFDRSTGDEILRVRDIAFSFDIKKLISLDIDGAFSRLVLNDVDIDFDMEKYSGIIERIVRNFAGEEDKEKDPFTMETLRKVWDGVFKIPFSVQVKNINARYRDGDNEVSAKIRMMDVNRQQDGRAMGLKLDGEVLAGIGAIGGMTVGEKIRLDGKLVPEISGSSATINLGVHGKADYSVRDTEFLLRYSDGVFAVQTTKHSRPYSIGAEYDIESGDVSAALSTDDLDPFSLIKMPALTGTLAKLKGLKVSADGNIVFNLPTGRYRWTARGSVGLPAGILSSYEKAVFNLSGNNSIIRASSLGVYGDMIGATFTGSMNLGNFMPSGELHLDHFKMPNGAVIRGDAYLDPVGNGITCFIPQLYLGEQDFTALQLELNPVGNAVNFRFSVNDYSHQESDQPGTVALDGTVTLGSNMSVHTGVEVDRLYLDSVVSALAFFMSGETKESFEKMAPNFAPYIMSGEVFLSTDMKSLTFNCPYVVVANTEKERQMLFLSMNGSNETVNLTTLDLLYDRFSVSASASMDIMPQQQQLVFSTDFSLNNIPYKLNGLYSFGQWLSVTGDYGLELDVNFNNPLQGVFRLSDFPLSIYGFLINLSARSSFTYSSMEGFKFNLENLTVEDMGSSSLGSKLTLSGSVDGNRVEIDDIGYSDSVSSLTGGGSAEWDMSEEGILSSASLEVLMNNDITGELVSIEAGLANPEGHGFDTILKDWTLSADVEIQKFPMARFMEKQGDDNFFTGSVHAEGTLAEPLVNFNLDSLSLKLGDNPLNVHGNASYSGGRIEIPEFQAEWLPMHFADIKGFLDLETFNGELKSDITVDVGDSTVSIPLDLSFEGEKDPVEKGSDTYYADLFKIPEDLTFYLDADPVKGDILKMDIPLHFILQRSPGLTIITSDDFLGLSGYVYDTGEMEFSIDEAKPLHFDFSGAIDGANMDFHVRNLFFDMSKFAFMINSDMFSLYGGILSGNADVSGLFSDPVFDGALMLEGLDVNLPNYIPEHITAKRVNLNLSGSEISIPTTNFIIKTNNVAVDAAIKLDRWSPNDIVINMSTGQNGRIPFDIDIPFVHVKGEAGADLHLLYNTDGVDLRGDISIHNTEATVIDSLSDLTGAGKNKNGGNDSKSKQNAQQKSEGAPLPVSVDLNLLIGQKVNFVVNPILRGMLAPDSSLHFTMDSLNSLWSVSGDVALRGGEVFYLSRNFYLTEGKVFLNENQSSFDPELTLRAQTRERDSDGRNITITLEAVNQKASEFNPTLTANPVKSENEIMELLGQIATGDSSSVADVAVAAGDFVAQTVLTRKLENALRDLLNFDILSLRTTVLQNVINQTIANSNDKEFSGIGNFFDNTTVYIGKYLGRDIYVDALMQWSFDDSSGADNFNSGGGLVFRPEVGFEMLSPFGNIRWQFAPDFGSLQNSVVSSTSLTLSWRLQL